MKPLGASDPAVVGSYRLVGVLGSGGMGRVYLAESRAGRPVAIKVLRAELVDDPDTRKRFAREVAAARAISPLFTAAVVDADPDADPPWLATTYIDGPSLQQWVDGHGPLSPRAVLTLAAGLAEALGSIHGAGLVHRDLKPSNVLLADTGPHVIDFGLALALYNTRLTRSLVVGTPSYLAPECIHGNAAGPPADIFALGATLVFAAAGRSLVVEDDNVYAQMLQITRGRFDLSAVPAQLRPLIVRCLGADPKDRPTADELTSILVAGGARAAEVGWHQADDGEPISSLPRLPSRGTRVTRRRLLAAAGVGTGVAALGGAGIALASWRLGRSRTGAVAPGSVLWQARSGAGPSGARGGQGASGSGPGGSGSGPGSAPGPAGPRPGGPGPGPDRLPDTRVLADPARRVVAANASEVYALDVKGARLWTHGLPARLVDAQLWRDAVLVADLGRLWLLDRATGKARVSVDAGAPGRNIRRVVCSPERAFVGVDNTVVALDGDGRTRWRDPAGNPHVADAAWLVTHDRTGGTVHIGLHEADGGRRRWATEYTVPDPPPPPEKPRDGAPPRDGGPPPPQDEAWQRPEGVLGGDFVALRDDREIRVLRLSDGTTVWQRSWPNPVGSLASVGDLLLLGGADRLHAVRVTTGDMVWQSPLRGARIALSTDRRTIVTVTQSSIAGLDLSGRPRWQAYLPESVRRALPDRLTVDGRAALVTFRPDGERLQPLDVDVIAFALGS